MMDAAQNVTALIQHIIEFAKALFGCTDCPLSDRETLLKAGKSPLCEPEIVDVSSTLNET